jgi:hypothetical protein
VRVNVARLRNLGAGALPMQEIFSAFEFSFNDFANNILAALFLVFVGASLRFIGLRLWRYFLSGNRARKKWGYIEIWKRVKSDSYFMGCQTQEIVMLVFTTSYGVLLIVSIGLIPGGWKQQLVVVFPLALVGLANGAVYVWETMCNKKAIRVRMLLERKERKARIAVAEVARILDRPLEVAEENKAPARWRG